MKRVYSKPCIAVENFILQDSIAAGCSAKINIGSSCADHSVDGVEGSTVEAQIVGFVDKGYFVDGLCSKKYSGGEADPSDGVCYFTAANNVFRS